MTKIIDMTGKRVGRLTVIERAGNEKQGQARWRCICSCGNEAIVPGRHLRNGKVKSCGCKLDDYRRTLRSRHPKAIMNTPICAIEDIDDLVKW